MRRKLGLSLITLTAVFFLACSLTRCGSGSSGPTYSAGINGMKF